MHILCCCSIEHSRLLLCTCLLGPTAETAEAPAPPALRSNSHMHKDAAAHSHHVTATAHSASTSDTADCVLDAMPTCSDQAYRHAEPSPVAAAAKQHSPNAMVRHMPHADLRHLMASANRRPYTGGCGCTSMPTAPKLPCMQLLAHHFVDAGPVSAVL
jgi:hypothetical protein